MIAAGFALLVAFALAVLRPPLFIYWASALGLGLVIQFLWRRYRSSDRRRPPEIDKRSWGLSKTEILIVVVIIMVMVAVMVPRFSIRETALVGFDIHYRAQITLTGRLWNIEEGLVVPGKELANMDEKFLIACGWEALGTADANALFMRRRSQPALTQWWPAYSVQVIHFPQPDCGQAFPLRPAIDSVAKLDVPKYFLIRTYPAARSRDEILGQDREALNVPLEEFGDSPDGGLRLEVLSPALRNRIGASLATISGWEPIKWVGATLLLLFSEQIKRGILEPFMRWLFRLVGAKYRDGQPPPEPESPLETGEGR